MHLIVLYDDTRPPSAEMLNHSGVDRFSRLLFRRLRLVHYTEKAAVMAGAAEMHHLRGLSDLNAALQRTYNDPPDSRYVVLPSHAVSTQPFEDFVCFIEKLKSTSYDICVGEAKQQTPPMPMALGRSSVQKLLTGMLEHCKTGHDAPPIQEQIQHSMLQTNPGFIDLRDPGHFATFISSSFETRHFNAIEHSEFLVIKRSRDTEKLRREVEFYRLLDDRMKMFFVQPFGFTEGPEGASYHMERAYVPNVAIQWVHGALTDDEFERLIRSLFFFLKQRTRSDVSEQIVKAKAQELYVDKVHQRLAELRTLPDFDRIDRLSDLVLGDDGIETLFKRYFRVYDRLAQRRRSNCLVVGHGDLCFSNILYGKTLHTMKFIDPRGGLTHDDVLIDEYYDLAKLSHSILGNYDFINGGLFDLRINDSLSATVDLTERPSSNQQQIFLKALSSHGYNAELVRLYEVSLFLSMLPLHIDRPRNVVAFMLNAAAILTRLENA